MTRITTALMVMTLAGTLHAQEFATNTHGAVTSDGQIQLPGANFRSQWAVLGTWAVLDGEEAAGMHVVYTQPGVIEYFLETGEFPDGTVLIKELLAADTGPMTTGTVARGSEVEGWFVMVKDSQGRFGENPLWGDGWGWAQFSADEPTQTFTENYKQDCKACHIPARKTDWIYTQGYPVLTGNQ